MTNHIWIVENLWSAEHNAEAHRRFGWGLKVTLTGNIIATPRGAEDVMRLQAREGEPLAKRGLAALAAHQLTEALRRKKK